MKKNLRLSAALAALAAAVLAFAPGCESAEANDVTVSPGHATVSKGGSVRLSANGWDNFRWTLSNGDIGVLSATVGREVVYTSIAEGEATQRVTATAIGSGATATSSPASTNSTASASLAGYSASSVITHR